MATKNVTLSEPILEAMQEAAQETGEDINVLVDEAAMRWLTHRRLDSLAKYGQAQSLKLGLEPLDSVKAVRDIRRDR